MKSHIFNFVANFIAVILLVALIATPLYFAKNFAQVAGVKSQSKYLLISQIEKFPNMKLSQSGDSYQISFTKQGESQLYQGILILNNPLNTTQTYAIKTEDDAKIFFGEDINNLSTTISLPASTSIPISIFSNSQSQSVDSKLTIEAK